MKIEEYIKTGKFISEEQKAQVNILYTASIIKNNLNNRLKKFDLTHEQFNVLRIIKGKYPEPICVREISESMIEPNSNTTRILDKLEQKLLVKRTPSKRDRRELWIILTDTGLDLLNSIADNFAAENPFSTGLSLAEASLLNNLLNKMNQLELTK